MADLCSGLNIPQEVGQVRYLETESTWDKTPHCTCRAEAKSRNKAKAQEVKSTNKAKSKQVTEFSPNFMTHPVLVRMNRKVGLKFSKFFFMFEMSLFVNTRASR